MILSFKCKETEKIWNQVRSNKLPTDIQGVALRKLAMIDRSLSLQNLRVPPANQLKLLTGKRKGQYSIRINNQWRICFTWKNENAYNIEIVDYH